MPLASSGAFWPQLWLVPEATHHWGWVNRAAGRPGVGILGMGHHHGHGGHHHGAGGGSSSTEHTRRALTWALALNGLFLLVELGVGWVTGSLALLSDAMHMLSDVAALALALWAVRLALRPATSERSFGFLRAEVLGAFVNALLLLVACFFIFKEAAERLISGPPEVAGLPVLIAE